MTRFSRGTAGLSGRFWHLLLEGVVIVISVILALVAEDWRSGRDARADAQTALRSLDEEAAANLREIDDFLEVVRGRYARLAQVEGRIDGTRPFADHVSDFGGFRVPDLHLSSWSRVGADPRVREHAPERLAEAFVMYRDISFLSGLDQQILEFTVSPDYHDAARAEVSYRIAEGILSQQIVFAENAASRLRAFLQRESGGS